MWRPWSRGPGGLGFRASRVLREGGGRGFGLRGGLGFRARALGVRGLGLIGFRV